MTKEEILKQEYPQEADEIRKKMVIVAFFKYGSAKDNFGKGRVDAVLTAVRCVGKYQKTGNTEYLLDAMNYLGFEFKFPTVHGAFYTPTDSDGSAGTVGTPINKER